MPVLKPAEKLANVLSCNSMGYYRDTFYEVRSTIQVGGVAALGR